MNETASEQRVEVTLYKLGPVDDSENLPRTLTEETPQPADEPLFEREFRVDANDSKRVSKVFSKPEDPTEYRVFVRFDGGAVKGYAFATYYGSGLLSLLIKILSPSTASFHKEVV